MRQKHLISTIFALLLAFGSPLYAGEVIERFSGYGSGETAEFEVEAPWIIDWVVNGDYPQMMAIEVALINAASGQHEGFVLKTKEVGNGVRMFEQSGRFRLRVDSAMSRWNFKIEQLTPEEAALYTPVVKEKM